jgi:hypothetical protein
VFRAVACATNAASTLDIYRRGAAFGGTAARAGRFDSEPVASADRIGVTGFRPMEKEAPMLGRHVYRVTPQPQGGWIVRKDGDASVRARRDSIVAATDFAAELAAGDPPSKIIVEGDGGTVVEERVFGDDSAASLERAIGDKPVGAPLPGTRKAGTRKD